jgi:hypothetical protein
MKMIGVCSELLRCRMSRAVSKPSIPGMLTSSRINANSRFRRDLSASSPEFARTISSPSSASTASSETSFCS